MHTRGTPTMLEADAHGRVTCVAPPGNELYEGTAQAGLEEPGSRGCLCRQVGLEMWKGWANSRQTKHPRSVGHTVIV